MFDIISNGNSSSSNCRWKYISAVLYIFKGKETIHSTKVRNIYFIQNARTKHMQENWLWILLWRTICDKVRTKYNLPKCNIFWFKCWHNQRKFEFQYYFNNTDVKPLDLDGGHDIILANWPNSKHVICNHNHNFPNKIPSHLYVLLKRTILCNCGIEAENNFLLESTAACPVKQSALTMYYTVNTVFMHYFDSLTYNLETHISQNWTTQEQVFPISLQKRLYRNSSININKKDK